jgi:RimJ/RimL family protein N-acetyltransferase
MATAVTIRRIERADSTDLERFYAGLSAESRRLRFLSAATTLGDAAVRQFCGPDHEHREGFVALASDPDGDERMVGHLCLEPSGPDEMEIAVAVADGYQGLGIGTRLVDEAARWASAHGTRAFRAWFATDNPGIRRLLAHLNRPISREGWACGSVEISIDLTKPPVSRVAA